MNIYSLYISRSKPELDYFYRILHTLQFTELKNTTVQMVHIDFRSNDNIPNIRFQNTEMTAFVYTFEPGKRQRTTVTIYNLDTLIGLYVYRPGTNVFIYSGHSDGMYLAKKKVRLLRIEDFCELSRFVNNNKKADLMIFDCCCCANIGTLYVCYNFTKYLMASTSYQSYLSVLETQSLYKSTTDIPKFVQGVIKELGSLEKIDHNAYDSNFCLYNLNETVLELVQLTMKYKYQFNYSKSYTNDYSQYKDLECAFKYIGINIKPLLDKIVVFSRYTKTNCRNRKVPKKKESSIPSSLTVILKRPIRTNVPTSADIFLLKSSIPKK